MTIAALVYSMLQSLVVPALTTIQRDLHTSETASTWVVSSLLLSTAIATPILGRLGDMFGYFGSKPYSDSFTGHPYWNLTGYPAAIAAAARPSYQLGIAVNEADAGTDALDLEHRGDSTGGDSGGPFWGTWPDGFPYVIGTVSGGETITNASGAVVKDTNNCAGGNAINDLIRWGRTNWS